MIVGNTIVDGNVTWKVSNDQNNNVEDEDQYLVNNFTIIYPNGGTENSPANVATNSSYVSNNPFPGYYVNCVAEVYYNNHWGPTEWLSGYSGEWISYGTKANQFDDNYIVTQTGIASVLTHSNHAGNPFQINNFASNFSALPCRVKVWKVGKIPTN